MVVGKAFLCGRLLGLLVQLGPAIANSSIAGELESVTFCSVGWNSRMLTIVTAVVTKP